MTHAVHRLAAIGLCVCVCGRTFGQERDDLAQVKIEGERYTSETTIAGKTPAAPREIPSSVSVLTQQRIEDENLTTVDEALTRVTGVTVVPNAMGQSQYRSRGYVLALMNDGVPAYNSLSGYQQFDLIVYERLEVLRGPSGVLQGSSEPGGSLNLVSKHGRDVSAIKTSVTASRWNNERATLDVTTPLDASGSVRARSAFAFQRGDAFVDSESDGRRVAYGVVDWDVRAGTTLSASVAWQDDRIVAPYMGVPANADTGQQLGLPRSTNTVPPWARHDWRTIQYRGSLSQQLSSRWQLHVSLERTLQDFFFHDAYPADGVRSSDLTIPYARREYDVDYRREAADVYLAGSFTVFGRDHSLLLGYNYDSFDSQSSDVDLSGTAQQIRVPFVARNTVPDFDRPYNEGSLTETLQRGLYAQARLKLLEPLALNLGSRLSDFDTRSRAVPPSVMGSWRPANQYDGKWIPYGGLVYDVTKVVSLYSSYASVFVPQSTSLKAEGTSLNPRVGSQYEVGSKAALLDARLDVSVAAFYLRDHNRALADPDHPGFFTEAGLVESKGWEVEINGSITRTLNLQAGYTRLDTEYVRAAASRIGQTFDFSEPRHNWKLWALQRLSGFAGGRLKVGLGVTGQSGIEFSPQREQGGYSIVNALMSYGVAGRYSIDLNATNIFDRRYFARLGGTNTYNTYGEPASFSVTARFQR